MCTMAQRGVKNKRGEPSRMELESQLETGPVCLAVAMNNFDPF